MSITSRMMTALLAAVAGTASAMAAPFIPGNLAVSQIGADGSTTALSSAATAVFVKEFTTAGSLVQTIALPTAASGSQRAFSNSGSATSEGTLTRSVDGRFLTIGGYDAAPGVASIASTSAASVRRVVARLDLAGNVDTSTALGDTGYSANNIRSVVSTDGTSFYVGGTAGTTTSAGVRLATFGLDDAGTRLSDNPTNTRVVNIFNNQLYVSTQSGAFRGVNTVGTGVPTTGGQTTSLLPGFSPATNSAQNAYDFFFADANTLYVADERTSAGNGLQKWIFDGTNWVLQFGVTSISGVTGNFGVRGLTGAVDPTGRVTLYAITAEGANNRLVTITDLISNTSGTGLSFTQLAQAGSNTIFRGVDFTPVPTPASAAVLALGGLVAARRRRA